MLLDFWVKNFKSFKDETRFSMEASSLREAWSLPKAAFIEPAENMKILPVAAIYGANASGKSNLFLAMMAMRWYIQTSLARENILNKIPVEPFRLSSDTKEGPTEFEISFLKDNRQFRYGFVANSDIVLEEWLWVKELKKRNKEKEVFYREKDSFSYHPQLFSKGKVMQDSELVKNSVLLLTLGYQLNDETARSAMEWFVRFNTLTGNRDHEYKDFSYQQIQEKTEIEKEMQELIRLADIGIKNLSTGIVMDRPSVFTHHDVYDEKGDVVGEYMFILDSQQSEGTQKFFHLLGPILYSLKNGNVLFVDEMDTKLHPNLMEKMVELFQDQRINTNRAQLIFTTHNTNLMDARLLRRDQVWITEKDRFGATRLYSIAEYRTEKGKARNKEAIETNYIEGKYGGVPFLGNWENYIESKANGTAATGKH
jgi:AAA15 family ATPase/GTPase